MEARLGAGPRPRSATTKGQQFSVRRFAHQEVPRSRQAQHGATTKNVGAPASGEAKHRYRSSSTRPASLHEALLWGARVAAGEPPTAVKKPDAALLSVRVEAAFHCRDDRGEAEK